jgi:uncharacterized protein YndB with AHSA1/START domain
MVPSRSSAAPQGGEPVVEDTEQVKDVSFVVERAMRSSPEAIFDAWTQHFDTWFARPGAIAMEATVGQPYWFDVEHEGSNVAHYGIFLAVERHALLELTWVSGRGGTDGAETVLRIELTPLGGGTLLRLSHGGFYDDAAAERHRSSWPTILDYLDDRLSTTP